MIITVVRHERDAHASVGVTNTDKMTKNIVILVLLFIVSNINAQFYEINKFDTMQVLISKNNVVQNKITVYNNEAYSQINEYEMKISYHPKADLNSKVAKRVKNFIIDYEKGYNKKKLARKYKDIQFTIDIITTSETLKLNETRQTSLINLFKIDIDFNDYIIRDLDIYCIDFFNFHKCTNQNLSTEIIKFYSEIK